MSQAPAPRPRPSRRSYLLGFLVGPLGLLAAAFTLRMLLVAPGALFGWVFSGLAVVTLGWIGVSVFWPARAERNCPICSERGLERLSREDTIGQHCTACGWTDDSVSSWLLAEDEGTPMEPMVLEQRRKRRAGSAREVSAQS